jgi:Leucine-rich repeat (LRR) protein
LRRLDLAQNQMFYLDSEFKKLSRLRYLDIRSNKFREFPEVVLVLFKPPLIAVI